MTDKNVQAPKDDVTPGWTRRHTISGLTGAMIAGSSGAAVGQAPGSNWIRLATEPYRGKQDDIAVLEGGDHAWYGNGAGRLFRTTDGGDTWSKIWDQPGTFIRALAFVDEQRGFLGNVGVGYYPDVTDPHPLYRTEDGGHTWKRIEIEGLKLSGGICGLHVLRRQRIFQGEARSQIIIHAAGRVGGPAHVYRSEDGGDRWTFVDVSSQAGMILDVCFLTAETGFVCASTSSDLETGRALILRTTDGARTWTPVYTGERPFENCWKISFPSPLVGYATVQSYNEDDPRRIVVKTEDGGRSWRELDLTRDPATREFGIGFVDERRGWVGTRARGYETRDGGASWIAQDGMGQAANKIRVVGRDGRRRVFAIGTHVSRLDVD